MDRRRRGPRFLRAFGVPFGALARVFGRTPMYGYRPEVGLGRNGVVGATLRRATRPERLRADDHHPPRDGVKNPVATTVGGGCGLGAALAPTAGADDLRAAYGVFRAAAHDRPPGDRPAAANTDGWAATRQAWSARFPLVVVPRCVPHGWPAIRSRGEPADGFRELSAKVWDAYHAGDRRAFAQRPRRLREWAGRTFGAGRVREHVDTLCGRAAEYGGAYAHPGGHRTSTMPDRVMRGMSRYFDAGPHLHGTHPAGDRHVRAWALLHNFRPWHPAVARANGGGRCPAERVNRHRYLDGWRHNRLVSASLGGYHR